MIRQRDHIFQYIMIVFAGRIPARVHSLRTVCLFFSEREFDEHLLRLLPRNMYTRVRVLVPVHDYTTNDLYPTKIGKSSKRIRIVTLFERR